MRILILTLAWLFLSATIRLPAAEVPPADSAVGPRTRQPGEGLKRFSITQFRHGQSGYTQGDGPVALEAAADLCAKPLFEEESIESRQARAIEEVRRSASDLARTLDPDVPVTVTSSPAGRALHTAKVIRDALAERGFRITAIEPDLAIGEVRNFAFALMEPLIKGGRFTHETEAETYDFIVNKSETNPDDLVYPEYFMTDAVQKIPAEAMRDWPDSYVGRLKSFETFAAVKRRGLDRIRALGRMREGHFVLVSHSALSLNLSDQYTGGRKKGLAPASFISIDRTGDGRLVVTRVGEITDGDSETDFITNAE